MADHDQLFKVLLREFFADFIRLFFPQWAERIDFGSVEWQDKELFLDPPHGEKRSIDLIAKLRLLEPADVESAQWVALLHVEIESADKVAPFRPRMFVYYEQLRRHFQLPVLPIALLLRVGLEGIGWDVYEESFWGQTLVSFRYPYVGLPALDATQYLAGDNWLGVALTALMRAPKEQRLVVAQQAWRRLLQCPVNEYQRYLLCDVVDTYTGLTPDQRDVVEQSLLSDPDPGVRVMSVGLIEKWKQQGHQEGLREALLLQIQVRFGSVPESARERIEQMPMEKVREALAALFRVQTLDELLG